MSLTQRIEAFKKLGIYLNAIDAESKMQLFQKAKGENAWFTEESLNQSLNALASMLRGNNLDVWLANYTISERQPKVIGLVLAGNIPLVGFHDVLSVLITGNKALIKPSSKDSVLLRFLLEKLVEIEPGFKTQFELVDQLRNFDAIIATGSDNSARYFEHYFRKYPSVIRKNRTSCAILSGFETDEELINLGDDVFSYFGLGCRNISKLYVPEGFDFVRLINLWKKFEHVMMLYKYHNNYDYQKSILLVNRIPFFDSGFVLFQESEKLVSPISVLYYQHYADLTSLKKVLTNQSDKIQCIVGNMMPANVRIGNAQYPGLSDYADNADTISFLMNLL